MDKVIPLEYGGRTIRTLKDEQGKPWFVAADICKCLGLALHARSGKPNVTVATRDLSGDEKQLRRIDTSENPRNPWTDMMTISEPGLQKLVHKCDNIDAQRLYSRMQRLVSGDEAPVSQLDSENSTPVKLHINQL